MVNDLIASNREAEDRAANLAAELEATKASLSLLAQSKNINPAELDDHLLAAEIMQDQLNEANDEANGEQLDAAPSGSGAHPQPILRPVPRLQVGLNLHPIQQSSQHLSLIASQNYQLLSPNQGQRKYFPRPRSPGTIGKR